MTLNTVLILLMIGILAGFMSGLVGIGGGIVIVPMLVYLLGYNQHLAQGTSLFMFLFPIGILGVMNYWQKGYVDYKTSLIICITFILGSYLGSKLAINLEQHTIRKVFGFVFLLIALKMISGK
jgi:uncharacterized protein